MEALLTLLYLLIFLYVIRYAGFFNIPGLSKNRISVFFIIKVLCGIALTFIYTYYYKQRETADIFKYFDDGKIMYTAVFSHPFDYLRMVTGFGSESGDLNVYYEMMNYCHRGVNYGLYNDYITMIRFNAAVNLFSLGYYSVHTVFMAFISFTGLTAVYKTFLPMLRDKQAELQFAVYFIPSVLLWSSGVLKEGIMMLGIGLLCLSLVHIISQFSWKYFLLLIFSFILLFVSKMYILIALLPGIVTIMILQKTGGRFSFLKFSVVHMIFLFLAFNLTIFEYDFLQILSYKQQDFAILVKTVGNVGSLINIPELYPTWLSFVKNSPGAFLNALVRPHMFESYSPIVFLSSLENIFLSCSIILSLVFINLKKIPDKGWLYLCLSFTGILFILSGLTTPVMGALVRYRAPALPFLMIALLFMFDKNKFCKKFSRKK